ncbi:hypothetical protein ABEZ21_08040 [Brevibacillus porteri]|uniref:Uncharacterized protein n=1 Tax=Brevibacillus porteri TaxID=2126350 RepID=A0ABX5FIV8_9BACL|nr:hypothetical protein [Brevibacillus porteri]MED2745869.1 hypothetical protein [Brevibacillus porteri]MED2813048.1 hypothetical protein [Brevibacillus porteri]MED4899487.1 hypothetical protein [Brevibacillus porteri]PSK04620.1 hypothetical protein C7R92_26715 [Brevibacillus porteri]
MNLSALTTFVLAFIALGSGPVSANGTGSPVAYLCEDADYQGYCLGLYAGTRINTLDEKFFNDKASSIKILDNRYNVTVFEHLNWTGRSTTYLFSDRDMSDEKIGNDEASSLYLSGHQEELNGVYLYDNYGMSGDWIKVTSSASTIPLNDKISSIRIVGPYDITIFEHANFTGRSLSFSGNAYLEGTTIPDLVPHGFNDITSSILITKR